MSDFCYFFAEKLEIESIVIGLPIDELHKVVLRTILKNKNMLTLDTLALQRPYQQILPNVEYMCKDSHKRNMWSCRSSQTHV